MILSADLGVEIDPDQYGRRSENDTGDELEV